ncbi:MAG TPA: hypothetical protein VF592_13540 [Sphingomonas sp.]|uniref:hypothetical protein n=1 Tax=Sphingomonas sp. TaxID=28214 RepID=UPI002EDA39A8
MSEETRRKRRWINLAEFVAIAGLVLAALGFWSNWSERREAAAEKQAAALGANKARARLDLRASVEDGRRVVLSDPRHELQEVVAAFPKILGVADRRPVAAAAIERDWFEGALLKATDGGADAREGRLPVLVSATYLDGDTRRSGSAIVDIAWATEGRLIGGRMLTITAARLRELGGSRARIDALWARELAAAAR